MQRRLHLLALLVIASCFGAAGIVRVSIAQDASAEADAEAAEAQVLSLIHI